jgi:hypothetical protein
MWGRAFVLCAILAAGPALAQADRSLDKCQKIAAKETAKLMSARAKTVALCQHKISGEVIKHNDPAADAAKACTAKLRKLINTDKPLKTLDMKMRAKISKACDPSVNPSLAHTQAQVLEVAAGEVEAKNLNDWCTNFGGDGSVDTIQEWIDCQAKAAACQADQQISVEYPRALEWLAQIETAIDALGTEQKYLDAKNAAIALQDSIDPLGTGDPGINCGPGLLTCGNGVADGLDQCDGADLDGNTCRTLGFISGTLGCNGDCFFDISGCVSGAFPATGQTMSYLAGDDGVVQAGASASFIDNGDGTITDNNSGLMWEKKSRDGSIHDYGDSYNPWDDAFAFIDSLNTMSFAGYSDWRLPNRHELETLLNLGTHDPPVYPEFDTNCTNGCTVLTCSCTAQAKYWSSTSSSLSPTVNKWTVEFRDGFCTEDGKNTTGKRVRAVRGGL